MRLVPSLVHCHQSPPMEYSGLRHSVSRQTAESYSDGIRLGHAADAYYVITVAFARRGDAWYNEIPQIQNISWTQ